MRCLRLGNVPGDTMLSPIVMREQSSVTGSCIAMKPTDVQKLECEPESRATSRRDFLKYSTAKAVKVYAFCRTQAQCCGSVSDYVFGTKGRASLLSYQIRGETDWTYPGPTGHRRRRWRDHRRGRLIESQIPRAGSGQRNE
jgi:hypothetical protein